MASRLTATTKFSGGNFSTPVIFKATFKLFGSQGCSDDKNLLDFSSISFKICRFRSSILLWLYLFQYSENGAISVESLAILFAHAEEEHALGEDSSSNRIFSVMILMKGRLL